LQVSAVLSIAFSFTDSDGRELKERKERKKEKRLQIGWVYLTLLSAVPNQQRDRRLAAAA
jgi:hypothetical protein